MKASGVLEKTALVFGQMNEPPGARMRVAETGLTMAEYSVTRTSERVAFYDNISDSHRLDLKFPLCLDVCHQL